MRKNWTAWAPRSSRPQRCRGERAYHAEATPPRQQLRRRSGTIATGLATQKARHHRDSGLATSKQGHREGGLSAPEQRSREGGSDPLFTSIGHGLWPRQDRVAQAYALLFQFIEQPPRPNVLRSKHAQRQHDRDPARAGRHQHHYSGREQREAEENF